MRARTSMCCAALLAGCSQDRAPTLSAVDAVAIGSSATGWVSFERCMDSIDDGSSCVSIRVPMESARIDAPEVFAFEYTPDHFSYTALAPGSTLLTVEADGETYARELYAAVPDSIEAELDCWVNGVAVWGDRAWEAHAFGTGTEVVVSFDMFAFLGGRRRELHHDLDVDPFESSLLTRVEPPSYGKASFRTPATPGTTSITSPFDPTLDLPIVVFGPGEVTGLEIHPAGVSLPIGARRYFDGTYLTVSAGEATCTDLFPRTLRVLTPATCAAWDGSQEGTAMPLAGREAFSLVGLTAGDCTIEVALDGTDLAVRTTYPVGPP